VTTEQLAEAPPTKPSVLIATPAYGGQLTHTYFLSMMKTMRELFAEGIPHGFWVIPTESLISRGRNRCAQMALSKGFDKLFFIDADMGWEPEDFLRIYRSEKAVIGGTAPMKQLDIRLVYNPLYEHMEALGSEAEWRPVPRTRQELELLAKLHANDKGELEMRHVGTGFLKIDCEVLKMLKPRVPGYEAPDTTDFTKVTKYWDFFPSGVQGEAYLSEDYGFCKLVKDHLDCGVWLDTKTVCTHTGVHVFRADAPVMVEAQP
jgi:hypothetical protein